MRSNELQNLMQIETRKKELEENLSINILRHQEVEAIIHLADFSTLPLEAEAKEQELRSSNRNLDELTSLLTGKSAFIHLTFLFHILNNKMT